MRIIEQNADSSSLLGPKNDAVIKGNIFQNLNLKKYM